MRHSGCTVYVLNTSSTSLIISHACLRWTWLFGACWTALHVVGVSLFCEAGERCQRTGFGYVHGSYGGRGLHAWLQPGRHLDLYIVFWTALHVVGVSLFCEAGERCVSGLAFDTRQLWWPWVACLAAAWEAFECVHYIIIDFVSSMYGHWY